MKTYTPIIMLALVAMCASPTFADFILNATTATPTDTGFYAGGSQLQLTSTGTISIYVAGGLDVNPNGSLVHAVGGNFTYANAGAQNYPTSDGGNGVNQYLGGGFNYDTTASPHYAIAGKMTTDSSDGETIRFGSVIGTFVSNPTRGDWFEIGMGRSVVVPNGGANLYLHINETNYTDNSGSFSVAITAVPEPSSIALVAAAIAGMCGFRIRKISRRTH
jgi:hypothetical protein